jgi:tRNA dimethylallyltransferase
MDFKSKIILIYGPTASGKSEFAVKLAKKLKGEIINADSMQVYKELKILSARPSKKDYKKIKHHLYGFQSVKENYSSGEWLKAAKKKILEIKKRKNVPIIVGGTGLYFKTLTDGIVNIPKIPMRIREKVRKLNSSIGNKSFLQRLKKIDPEILNYVNPSDTQRLIRAYEVKLFTKKTLLEWFKSTKSIFEDKNFYKIYIDYPRDILVNKIHNRTQDMINKGAILEVKRFLKMKVSKKRTATKAIGLIEIKDFIDKKIKISEVIERISIKTRQYAKRQVTWGRGNMMDWNKIKHKKLNNFLKNI